MEWEGCQAIVVTFGTLWLSTWSWLKNSRSFGCLFVKIIVVTLLKSRVHLWLNFIRFWISTIGYCNCRESLVGIKLFFSWCWPKSPVGNRMTKEKKLRPFIKMCRDLISFFEKRRPFLFYLNLQCFLIKIV